MTDLRTGKLVLGASKYDSTMSEIPSSHLTSSARPANTTKTAHVDHVDQADHADSIPLSTAGGSTSLPVHLWLDMAAKERSQSFCDNIPMLEHIPQVCPVFVNYKKVSAVGFKTPIVNVAITVAKSVGDKNVDAVQPTQNGQQIYIKTEADRAVLVASGIDLAGKHIDITSRGDYASSPNVKITIRDIPLHEIANDKVLQALKEFTEEASLVKYCNIWIDGRQTHLQNGDRFVYIPEGSIKDLPPSFSIKEMKACIFKPVTYAKCSYCH